MSRFKPLGEVRRVPYGDAFLIGDLVTTRMTFLTGEPKAGKSLFAAAMIRALVEGHEEFIGLPVLRKLDHVVYGYTDDGADEELRERLLGTEAEAHVSVEPMYDVTVDGWPDLAADVITAKPGLFVLDTVIGSLANGEDIATGVTAQAVVNRVRPISEAGIPVLLVTHTPKGAGEGLSVSASVMGGRAMAGGVRAVIALRKDSRGRRIDTAINRAREDLSLRVVVERESDDTEVPVWTAVEGAEGRRERRSDVWEERSAFFLEKCQGLSTREASNLLAERYGSPFETARDWLKPSGGIGKRIDKLDDNRYRAKLHVVPDAG